MICCSAADVVKYTVMSTLFVSCESVALSAAPPRMSHASVKSVMHMMRIAASEMNPLRTNPATPYLATRFVVIQKDISQYYRTYLPSLSSRTMRP